MYNSFEELKREIFDFTLAIHRVTELFQKDEALRKELRECSIRLLIKVSGWDVIGNSDKLALVRNISIELEALKNLLLLSQKLGLMKAINAEVLNREIAAFEIYFSRERTILIKVHETHGQINGEVSRTEKDKNDNPVINDIVNYADSVKKRGMSLLHRQSEKKMLKIDDFVPKGYDNIKKTQKVTPFSNNGINDTVKLMARATDEFSLADANRNEMSVINGNGVCAREMEIGLNERQGAIIDYLRMNKEAKMADIATIFSNRFSMKTLQRDLARLITNGEVVRQGDKRWAVYRLNRNAEL